MAKLLTNRDKLEMTVISLEDSAKPSTDLQGVCRWEGGGGAVEVSRLYLPEVRHH